MNRCCLCALHGCKTGWVCLRFCRPVWRFAIEGNHALGGGQQHVGCRLDVASYSESRFQHNNPSDEPKYHNRLHTADVITTMALQMAIEAKLSGKYESDWLAAGLLAAAGHDFMHSGQVNAAKFQIEMLSCKYMRPFLTKQAVPELWVQRIETAIVRTDFTLTPQNHQLVQGVDFEWNQAWLNVLLNEADILPSSTPVLGNL